MGYSKRAIYMATMDDSTGDRLKEIASEHIRLAKVIIIDQKSDQLQQAKIRIEQLRQERNQLIQRFQDILDYEEMYFDTYRFDKEDAIRSLFPNLSTHYVNMLIEQKVDKHAIWQAFLDPINPIVLLEGNDMVNFTDEQLIELDMQMGESEQDFRRWLSVFTPATIDLANRIITNSGHLFDFICDFFEGDRDSVQHDLLRYEAYVKEMYHECEKRECQICL